MIHVWYGDNLHEYVKYFNVRSYLRNLANLPYVYTYSTWEELIDEYYDEEHSYYR